MSLLLAASPNPLNFGGRGWWWDVRAAGDVIFHEKLEAFAGGERQSLRRQQRPVKTAHHQMGAVGEVN